MVLVSARRFIRQIRQSSSLASTTLNCTWIAVYRRVCVRACSPTGQRVLNVTRSHTALREVLTLISRIKTQCPSICEVREARRTKCSSQNEANNVSLFSSPPFLPPPLTLSLSLSFHLSGIVEIKSTLRVARLHHEGNAFAINMCVIRNSCRKLRLM